MRGRRLSDPRRILAYANIMKDRTQDDNNNTTRALHPVHVHLSNKHYNACVLLQTEYVAERASSKGNGCPL